MEVQELDVAIMFHSLNGPHLWAQYSQLALGILSRKSCQPLRVSSYKMANSSKTLFIVVA